ncbi:MAG: Ig-like domain-containing protein, partial [Colwellia sp.]|nr:Ig-like domain-containing protein [Colwellia sp.]
MLRSLIHRNTRRVLSFCILTLICFYSLSSEVQQTINIIQEVGDTTFESSDKLNLITGYRQHGQTSYQGDGTEQAFYELQVPVDYEGYYRIYAWWPQTDTVNAVPNVAYDISSTNSQLFVNLNQSAKDGQWNLLGEIYILQADSAKVRVASANDGVFTVDAFRIEYVGLDASELNIITDKTAIAVKGQQYYFNLEASGGKGAYSWHVYPNLPEGLVLDATTGVISGKATESGTFNLDITAEDSVGSIDSISLAFVIINDSGSSSASDPSEGAMRLMHSARMVSKKPMLSSTLETNSQMSLIDEIELMPEGSWKKINENFFSEVWAPAELRSLNGLSNPKPSKIVEAWSSFAWDSNYGDLIIYGGGHANYSGNDVYRWRSSTRRWERSALASEVVQDDLGNWRAIDGVFSAPSSAHTYDNNVYLPVAKRFMTYGGAAYNNGGPYKLQVDATTDRPTGPYVFDPALANGDQVGGTTGSHVQRVSPHPEVTGGQMWANRDINANISGSPSLPSKYINGSTAVTVENGVDVIYLTASAGGTAQQLYKHTITDINDPTQDSWEQVGRYWNGFGGKGSGAYSPLSNVFVRTAGGSFVYWDLTTPGASNKNELFTPEDPSGLFSLTGYYGMDFYPINNTFYLWNGSTDVWKLTPPSQISTLGWSIAKDNLFVSSAPNGDAGTGIIGKWKFAEDLNVFVGLQDVSEGNIWIYKPVGWQAPVPKNSTPSINLTSPITGTSYLLGTSITINADASDIDGSVVSVEFYQGTVKLGESVTPPYSIIWNNAPVGNYLLSAKAVDDKGKIGQSNSVSIDVTSDNISPTVILTSPSEGALFLENNTVNLTADAEDSDGNIVVVEFYSGTTKLGEDVDAPFSFLWTNLSIGTNNLTAKATDNEGASTTSSAISIDVVSDNILPTVSLISPFNGEQFVEGNAVLFEASASDSDGSIAVVEFYAGTTKLGELLAAPYIFSWSNATEGQYNLTAIAVDNEGAVTTSTTVAIAVISSNIAPIVSLTSPLDGDQYLAGDTIILEAIASDDDGTIAVVEFYAGATKLGEDLSAPYQYSWVNVSSGEFSLSARATDDKGKLVSSLFHAVSVSSLDGTVNVTLQDGLNGYSGTRDTYLSGWHVNNNFGNYTNL